MKPSRVRVAGWVVMPAFAVLALAAPAYPQQQPDAAPPASADRRGAEIEAFVAKADALIKDHNYDVKSTAHYKVKTDDPRFDVVAAAQLLESFRSYFDSFWQGRADLLPYDQPARIYLFYSRAKVKQLYPYEDARDDIATVGHYADYFDVVALHTDSILPDDFPDTLVHEAAHQLVQNRLYGPGRRPSIWLTEGLAEYFGNTLRDDGGFQTGKIGGKGVSFFKKQHGSDRRTGWAQARSYRSALKEGKGVTPDQLIRISDPDVFYEGRMLERYAASWMLVHFLLHAGDGAHAQAFVTYIKHEAARDGGPEALYKDLGMSPVQLEAAFETYLAKLSPK